MSTTGWIFMVGFRVFDIGALIVFLVWFFRLRDDEDDGPDDDGPGGGGQGPPPKDPGGGGLTLPLGRAVQGRRVRDGSRPPRPPRRRGAETPLRGPVPARVRRPRSPVPAHHR